MILSSVSFPILGCCSGCETFLFTVKNDHWVECTLSAPGKVDVGQIHWSSLLCRLVGRVVGGNYLLQMALVGFVLAVGVGMLVWESSLVLWVGHDILFVGGVLLCFDSLEELEGQ